MTGSIGGFSQINQGWSTSLPTLQTLPAASPTTPSGLPGSGAVAFPSQVSITQPGLSSFARDTFADSLQKTAPTSPTAPGAPTPAAPPATTPAPPTTTPAPGTTPAAKTPEELQKAAMDKADADYKRFTGAIGKLPENEQKDLRDQIDKAYNEAIKGKDLSDARKAQMKKMFEANTAADWAGKRAGQGPAKDVNYAKNLADLYYGANDYMLDLKAFLEAGGKLPK